MTKKLKRCLHYGARYVKKQNWDCTPITVQDGSLARGFWLAGWLAGWLAVATCCLACCWLAGCLAADRPLAGRGVCCCQPLLFGIPEGRFSPERVQHIYEIDPTSNSGIPDKNTRTPLEPLTPQLDFEVNCAVVQGSIVFLYWCINARRSSGRNHLNKYLEHWPSLKKLWFSSGRTPIGTGCHAWICFFFCLVVTWKRQLIGHSHVSIGILWAYILYHKHNWVTW